LVREGTFARVSLQLTTAKPAAKHVVPGRFDRFLDSSGDILGKEVIAVLYALVVAGPFLLIAALLLFAERTRPRRADHRLLEETACGPRAAAVRGGRMPRSDFLIDTGIR